MCPGGSRPRAGARQAIRLSNDEASETIIVAQESATEPQTAEISSAPVQSRCCAFRCFTLMHSPAGQSCRCLPS